MLRLSCVNTYETRHCHCSNAEPCKRWIYMAGLMGSSTVCQVERLDGLQHIRIPVGQQYHSPGSAYVEGDASSASYFLAGATITGMLL